MNQVFKRAEDIALHLTALMGSITKANGYETDIGTSVARGRRKIDDDQIPCSVIIEGEDRLGDTAGRFDIRVTQSYVLGGYDQCNPQHPNDQAHKIIRDIKRAVFTDKGHQNNWGGAVLKVEYRGRDIGPRADGVPIVFAIVHLDITYAEDVRNP